MEGLIMCENCYNLKSSFELFIERQSKFYMEYGIKKEDAINEAKKDLERHIDSLPVLVSKNLYEIYKQIG